MSLSIAIDKAQRRKRSTKQYRAEVRVDEIAIVAEIETDYQRADRTGDLQIESRFQELYQLVDSEAEKQAVSQAFVVWIKAERAEEGIVSESVGEAVDLLKSGNDFWLSDGCGPDGRAA